jgi:hypothetical protein
VTVDIDGCGHIFAVAVGNNAIVNHLQFVCAAGCSPWDGVLSDTRNGTSSAVADYTPWGADVVIRAVFQGRAGWGYTVTGATNGYFYFYP